MKAKQIQQRAVKVAGYQLEPGTGGLWFLVDDGGKLRCLFWQEGEVWRGTNPRLQVQVETIGAEVDEPHLEMARRLCGIDDD